MHFNAVINLLAVLFQGNQIISGINLHIQAHFAFQRLLGDLLCLDGNNIAISTKITVWRVAPEVLRLTRAPYTVGLKR